MLAAFAGWRVFLEKNTVTVNFISEPYEATIYVDGRQRCAPDGHPYRTPCTIAGLPSGEHKVVFQWDSGENPFDAPLHSPIDLGVVNFDWHRQISARSSSE